MCQSIRTFVAVMVTALGAHVQWSLFGALTSSPVVAASQGDVQRHDVESWVQRRSAAFGGRRSLLDDDDDGDDDDALRDPSLFQNLTRVELQQTTGNSQAGTNGVITVVNSAPELLQALVDGARHVDIRSHMVLHDLPIVPGVAWSEPLLPDVQATTTTITGSCTQPPSEALLKNVTMVNLRKLKDEQCLILTDADVFPVRYGNIWLHNLYMRASNVGGRDDVVEMVLLASEGRLWMSKCTIQGIGVGGTVAVEAARSFHAEDCVFADFGADTTGIFLEGPSTYGSFDRCTFASLAAGTTTAPPEPVLSVRDGAHAKLEDCTFETAAGRPTSLMSVSSGEIFSDRQRPIDDFTSGFRTSTFTKPIESVPSEAEFLDPHDPWLVQVQDETGNSVERADKGGGSSSSLETGAIIGIVGAVAAVIIICAVIFLVLRCRPQRGGVGKGYKGHEVIHYTGGEPESTHSKPASAHSGPQSDTRPLSNIGASHASHASAGSDGAGAGHAVRSSPKAPVGRGPSPATPVAARSMLITSEGTQNSTSAILPRPPRCEGAPYGPGAPRSGSDGAVMSGGPSSSGAGPGSGSNRGTRLQRIPFARRANKDGVPQSAEGGKDQHVSPPAVVRTGAEGVEERLVRIQNQLDSTASQLILNGLRFKSGHKSRLQGGQAVVQFATDIRTEREYAIKFFATREAFADEAALYSDTQNPLGKLLPRVRDIVDNHDGRYTDGKGDPLPPCIIMEKGEALNIWSRRNKGGLDHMTALQVLHHIAERLADLHDAGYVHRDLKQSNVMWQPRRNRWTLIDFGLVARIGEPVQIGFSLAYAAPEVVRAYRNGESTVIAHESVDAWSLGVLAVELFTNDVALDLMQGKEQVMSQIIGDVPLPWEDPVRAPSILKRFGLFKNVCLELLERDPEKRPSMVDFQHACRQVLALTTSNR